MEVQETSRYGLVDTKQWLLLKGFSMDALTRTGFHDRKFYFMYVFADCFPSSDSQMSDFSFTKMFFWPVLTHRYMIQV